MKTNTATILNLVQLSLSSNRRLSIQLTVKNYALPERSHRRNWSVVKESHLRKRQPTDLQSVSRLQRNNHRFNWLSRLDSNQVHQDQNLRYSHYTTGQLKIVRAAGFKPTNLDWQDLRDSNPSPPHLELRLRLELRTSFKVFYIKLPQQK